MDIKLKRLLAQGVKVNARNSYGDSPLHFAAHCCKDPLDCIKKLLMYEADINATNIHGNTPLHVIVNPPLSSNPPNAPKSKEKSILSSDNKNSTLQLHETLLDEVSSECITVLLEHGALADAKNRSSSTPLHCIQFPDGGLKYGVRLLVKYGASINAQNYNGETPLHKAVLRNDFNEDLLEELRKNGADFTKENSEHETPMTFFLHKRITHQINRISLCDLDCVKYLIMHTLFQMSQKINFETDTIKTFGDHFTVFDRNVFNHFHECLSELTRMEKDMITNKLSVKDYVTADKTIEEICFDSQYIQSIDEQLFDRLCNCSYPLYSYALLDAMNRSTLLNKLEVLKFHIKCSKTNEVVRLHSCSTLEIAAYLPDRDLLNFILAICGKRSRTEYELLDLSHIVKGINTKFITCFYNYSSDCCLKHCTHM